MKTLVLGLDGLSDSFWNIKGADYLIDYHGQLETYYWSLPSWLCTITGKEYDPRMDGDIFITHRSYSDKFIWDYLLDLRQTYCNIPVTYPAENINGAFIAGNWKTEIMDSNSVKPIKLLDKLINIKYSFEDPFGIPSSMGDWKSFFKKAIVRLHTVTKTIKLLYDDYEPDFMFAVYRVLDECLHQRVETRLGEDRIEKMKEILVKDLKKTVNYIKPETLIFVSDHSINKMGYHGPDHPSTKWGMWALKTNLNFIPPQNKAHILDIFPTILSSLDIKIPNVEGCSMIESKSDRIKFEERLRRLGYIE